MSNKDYSRDEYNKNYYNNKNAKNIEGDSKDVINDDINELIQNEELDDTYVNGKYKDCVFRMLFNSKEKLLELYNGLNGSHYTDTNNLKINTLSDAVYMGYKNDVSFVFNSYMYLFEHQSTYSPNLPLRNLIYVSRLLEKETKDDILYNKRLVPIDVPKFVVFYNGIDKNLPDKSQIKLSDMYKIKPNEIDLELTVTILNINKGKNKELMDICNTLREYSLFVDAARRYTTMVKEEGIDEYTRKGVRKAVDYCIENGILADFLKERKAEVISMTITEWNEEKVMKGIAEREYDEGHKDGLREGEKIGEIKNSIKTILNMYKDGMNMDKIATYTNKTIDVVEKICSISDEVEDASYIDEICDVYMKEIENV